MAKNNTLVTNSMMQCYLQCPRKCKYRYELGVRRITDTSSLRIGTIVHKFLEFALAGDEDAIEKVLTPHVETVPRWVNNDDQLREWQTERCKCAALLHAIAKHHLEKLRAFIDSEFQAEMPFEHAIYNTKGKWTVKGYRRAGKIDGIARMPDGRYAIFEHKTTTEDISDGSDYWKRLRIDDQISAYIIAARNRGYDVNTVIYNVMRVPEHKIKQVPHLDENGLKIVLDEQGTRVKNKDGSWKQVATDGNRLHARDETSQEYVERVLSIIDASPSDWFKIQEIPRTDQDLDDHRLSLAHFVNDIKNARKQDHWPRNTSSCTSRGRCEYLDVCHAGINPDDPPAGFHKVADLHPELKP